MARAITSLTNTDAPDSDYPYGRARNNTGTNNGTPVNEAMLGDMLQFFQKLLDEGNVTPNNLPDNAYSGFQLFEALQAYMKTYPYKSYTCLMNQSGSGAPTVVVMPGNSIGTIVWTRTSTGGYLGTLSGAFPDATKVVCFTGGAEDGFVNIVRASANTVTVSTRDIGGSGSDDILVNVSVEIRVYQ